ncbi:hypothetical protein PHYPSEUDO_001818 [Phytophthora pseudosyringae]|uniref:Uncharacterized protein n=1 Tax=Phytophthora pseudosyringae TaxID=221518 RepID=A0A8T1V4N9_9STRA|nr:hypothetical protein PHYPSEUDO_001818 [Phytophthora pseudosyringae]
MNRQPRKHSHPGRKSSLNRNGPNPLPRLANLLRLFSIPTGESNSIRAGDTQRPQRKLLTFRQLMSDPSNDGDRVPTGGSPSRNPAQLPDAPPVGGGASGAGGADGGRGATSGAAERKGTPDDGNGKLSEPAETPQSELDEVPAKRTERSGSKEGGAPESGKGAVPEGKAPSGTMEAPFVDDEPADRKGDHSSQDMDLGLKSSEEGLPIRQHVMSRSLARLLYQRQLSLQDDRSNKAQAAHPAMPGQIPPTRFDAPSDRFPDESRMFVGVPATGLDYRTEAFLYEGYGGLESLVAVESLSEEDIQDLMKFLDPSIDIRREVLVPRSQDSEWSLPEFRDLLESIGSQRKLASLVRHYDSEGLARKVFGMSTLLRRVLGQLRQTKEQLESHGLHASRSLLDRLTEIQDVKANFGLLNKYWETQFAAAETKLDRKASDHARDFKRAAREHDRQEEVLRAENDTLHREVDDLQAHVRSL